MTQADLLEALATLETRVTAAMATSGRKQTRLRVVLFTTIMLAVVGSHFLH
jgi:hypothetical protein